jgi:hypothetical protein
LVLQIIRNCNPKIRVWAESVVGGTTPIPGVTLHLWKWSFFVRAVFLSPAMALALSARVHVDAPPPATHTTVIVPDQSVPPTNTTTTTYTHTTTVCPPGQTTC